ncbi:NAD(P)/FAD-dependent oxidoreductase, partial [bacterium]|nr:NAD(P)/FAD-dependent oxidoreductase [bacterium]
MGIIGGGPAGSYLASLMSYDKPVIFERKSEIGKPIQCTGIVTNSIYRVLDKIDDNVILNTIDTFRIRAPNGKSIDIKLDKENIIIDRTKFDRFLLKKAIENNAEVKYKHKFKGYKIKGKKIEAYFDNGKKYLMNYLVGSDGPKSKVAQVSGMYGKREFLEGWQSRVKGKFDKNVVEIFLGLGEFAWSVPENSKVSRIGVIGKNCKKEYLKLISKYKVVEDQSGIIPLYNPKQKLQKGNIALIG